jgi:hypothetical protein
MTHDLDNAQIDANGHPECGDEYCAGFPDCPGCRGLREADRQSYETIDGDVPDAG